jgi:hypothetical protein
MYTVNFLPLAYPQPFLHKLLASQTSFPCKRFRLPLVTFVGALATFTFKSKLTEAINVDKVWKCNNLRSKTSPPLPPPSSIKPFLHTHWVPGTKGNIELDTALHRNGGEAAGCWAQWCKKHSRQRSGRAPRVSRKPAGIGSSLYANVFAYFKPKVSS